MCSEENRAEEEEDSRENWRSLRKSASYLISFQKNHRGRERVGSAATRGGSVVYQRGVEECRAQQRKRRAEGRAEKVQFFRKITGERNFAREEAFSTGAESNRQSQNEKCGLIERSNQNRLGILGDRMWAVVFFPG